MPTEDTNITGSGGRCDAAVQTLSDTFIEKQMNEHTTTTPTLEPKPDDELWFEDGDLTIVAGDEVEFRVYREPLLLHSPVLTEMVSYYRSTQSASNVPLHTKSDCGMLQLSDPPDDVRHFLRGFFAGSTLRVGMIHPAYTELSAQIRLGHKYGVKQMVQSSVDYLQHYFPETTLLTNWDIKDRFKPPEFQLHHAIGVVKLARLTGAHSLLPAALMACASLGRDLTKGFTRPDGTQEILESDDLVRCIAGRAAWTRATAAASHKVFQRAIAQDCKRRARCKPVFDKILERLADAEDALFDVTFRTPSAWTSHVNSSDADRILCPRCYAMVGVWDKGRQVEQAEQLLGRIPEIFGVPASDVDHCHTEASA